MLMAVDFLTNIEHIVVLALENRSFDHMCGYFGVGEGVTPGMSNPENPADPGSPSVAVSNDARYSGDLNIDPSHELLDVNVQLFGTPTPPDLPHATNRGFVLDYAHQPGNSVSQAHVIMKCFAPERLPVLRRLAQEFVLCDRWFASVPGQTWPNRFFLHAATSGGFVDNNFRDYPFRTIYEHLADAGYGWAIYFHDIPQSITIASLRQAKFKYHFKPARQFFLDAKTGNLPAYSFIEPRYFDFLRWKANDQHPPHDVRLGEHLIADVYEALRNGPAWDSTLFFLVYDEHGGIFDHVGPGPAPNPDGLSSVNPPFGFDRLGLRVPAVIVSPYVQKGVVDSTLYDHTSILATVRELFNLPLPLTQRDGAAHTISQNLGDTMRQDAPATLERPTGEPTADAFHADGDTARMTPDHIAQDLATGQASTAPLSEFQASLVDTANRLQVDQSPRLDVLRVARVIDNEHDAAVHVRDAAARLLGQQ
jgi:phospholipase C